MARLDEALEAVHAVEGPEALNECRALFRKRVPLHLRAYVAAALLMGAKGREQAPKRGRGGKDERAAKGPRARAEQASPVKAEEPAERQIKKRERRYEGEGITLFVGAGRRQRFYARVALDMLFAIPGVQDLSVGDVRTMDNYSFITVDPAVEELVVSALNGADFRGKPLTVNRAKKRSEQTGE